MDLIYTDNTLTDVGIMRNYTLDLAYGSDENDFELTTNIENNILSPGCLVYVEKSEYGGMVDGMTINTKEKRIKYHGRTWHGILNSKILEPDSGDDYLIVSGDINSVIAALISRSGLSSLFAASPQSSGTTVSSYQINRYVPLYDAIIKMCVSNGKKLNAVFDGSKVNLSAVNAVDFSNSEEFSGDQLDFEIEKNSNTANHLICLGKGELADRQVLHLYVNQFGNIVNTQYYTGIDEVSGVYDNANAESLEDLTQGGIDRLIELASDEKMQLTLDGTRSYDIGDIVGGFEPITKTTVSKRIVKKIVQIQKNKTSIQYKVGD